MDKINYGNACIEDVLVLGIKCKFTDSRLDPNTVPEGNFIYEISDDGNKIPTRIRKNAITNFYGTIITDEIFEFVEDGKTVLLSEDDFGFLEHMGEESDELNVDESDNLV